MVKLSIIYYVHLQDHKAIVDPTEYNVKAENQKNINVIQMLRQFNFTCKQFTRAMAIKRQLQLSVFNNAYYYNATNGTLVQVKGEEGIRNLTSILEYMEILASILQNIEVCSVVYQSLAMPTYIKLHITA